MAKEFLEFFAHANKELLSKIEVNQEIYGKMGYSGIHQDEPSPVPNTYYKRRQAYFEDHK